MYEERNIFYKKKDRNPRFCCHKATEKINNTSLENWKLVGFNQMRNLKIWIRKDIRSNNYYEQKKSEGER